MTLAVGEVADVGEGGRGILKVARATVEEEGAGVAGRNADLLALDVLEIVAQAGGPHPGVNFCQLMTQGANISTPQVIPQSHNKPSRLFTHGRWLQQLQSAIESPLAAPTPRRKGDDVDVLVLVREFDPFLRLIPFISSSPFLNLALHISSSRRRRAASVRRLRIGAVLLQNDVNCSAWRETISVGSRV